MQDDIMVSVVCIAYNHERFIRQALESFVTQKTNFKFEILVHDDASPDHTADIIREYMQKYPDLIRGVLQKENQFSLGKKSCDFIKPLVRGKYVAICEGDDWWTSPYKLQKQVDALEARPEIDICTHAATKLLNGAFFQKIAPCKTDSIIPIERVIEDGGSLVATSSIMKRAEFYLTDAPFTEVARRIDYTHQIYASLRGGMLYLAEDMSVYNMRTDGTSYTARCKGTDLTKRTYENRRLMLDGLDAYTEGRYRRSIDKYLAKMEVSYLLGTPTKEAFRKIKRDFPDGYARLARIKRLYVSIGTASPALAIRFLSVCRALRKSGKGKLG